MVIKVYVALITCSQEIKKNQQRTIMILESKKIPYVAIDITDPGQEEAKEYMTSTATPKPNAKVPVTPQIYNEAEYCGDYDQLDMANECDTLGDFLKMNDDEKKDIKIGITGILPEERKAAAEAAAASKTNGSASQEEREKVNGLPGETITTTTEVDEDGNVSTVETTETVETVVNTTVLDEEAVKDLSPEEMEKIKQDLLDQMNAKKDGPQTEEPAAEAVEAAPTAAAAPADTDDDLSSDTETDEDE